jgi:hypothetical protein
MFRPIPWSPHCQNRRVWLWRERLSEVQRARPACSSEIVTLCPVRCRSGTGHTRRAPLCAAAAPHLSNTSCPRGRRGPARRWPCSSPFNGLPRQHPTSSRCGGLSFQLTPCAKSKVNKVIIRKVLRNHEGCTRCGHEDSHGRAVSKRASGTKFADWTSCCGLAGGCGHSRQTFDHPLHRGPTVLDSSAFVVGEPDLRQHPLKIPPWPPNNCALVEWASSSPSRRSARNMISAASFCASKPNLRAIATLNLLA